MTFDVAGERRPPRPELVDPYAQRGLVLPELEWVGRAMLEDRFDGLASQVEPPTKTEREIYGRGFETDPAKLLHYIKVTMDRMATESGLAPERLVSLLSGDLLEEERDTEVEIPTFRGLQRGEMYLGLVERGVDTLEVEIDRRIWIAETSSSLWMAWGDPDILGRVMKVREPTFHNDGLSAWEYLQLGQVHSANEAVQGVLRGITHTEAFNPFSGLPKKHIHSNRIKMLMNGDIDLLGETIAGNMAEHIKECEACGESHQYLIGRAAEERQRNPQSADITNQLS